MFERRQDAEFAAGPNRLLQSVNRSSTGNTRSALTTVVLAHCNMNIDSNTSADPSMSQSTSPPRSSSAPRPSLGRETSRPKGILKNAAADGLVSPSVEMDVQAGTQAEGVKWDEVNLSLNDVNRDSTMKITEPKTPVESH